MHLYCRKYICLFFYILLSILCNALNDGVIAQVQEDIILFKEVGKSMFTAREPKNQISNPYVYGSKDEPILNIFPALHSFYRHFIVSQDAGNCPFYPSCSNYFIATIYNNGFILGILDGSDRLLRCNGLSKNMYYLDEEHKKLKDPVPFIKKKENED